MPAIICFCLCLQLASADLAGQRKSACLCFGLLNTLHPIDFNTLDNRLYLF